MISGLPGTKRTTRSVPNAGGGGEEDSTTGSATSFGGVSGVSEPDSTVAVQGTTLFATDFTAALGGVAATGVGLARLQPQFAAAVQQSTPPQIRIHWPARNVIAYCSDWQTTPQNAPNRDIFSVFDTTVLCLADV
jgi:hypothetical protein